MSYTPVNVNRHELAMALQVVAEDTDWAEDFGEEFCMTDHLGIADDMILEMNAVRKRESERRLQLENEATQPGDTDS